MNRLSLYTLGFASVFACASVAVAQGTGDATTPAPTPAATPVTTDNTPMGTMVPSKPISFGVLAGATIPTGNLSDVAGTGWHAGAFVTANHGWPLSFRLEGVYDRFGSKDINEGAGTTASEQPSIVSGRLNAIWHFPMTGDIRPYIIGGVGLYHVTFDETCSSTNAQNPCGDVSASSTKFGVNAGAGIDMHLSGFSVFVEGRWHDIFTSGNSAQMIPVSVGIRF